MAESEDKVQARWWTAWWAQDFSCAGLAAKPVGKNGRTVHGGRRGERTLQEWWRRDPASGSSLDDAALLAAGKLVRAPDGALWHLVHVPFVWADGAPAKAAWDAMARDRLADVIAERFEDATEVPVDHKGDAQVRDGRVQLQGAVLLTAPNGAPPSVPPLVADWAAVPRWDAHSKFIAAGTRFDNANFVGESDFAGAGFRGYISFRNAACCGKTGFEVTRFQGEAIFDGVDFRSDVSFKGTYFYEKTSFDDARFHDYARFEQAFINNDANFANAIFTRNASFEGVLFKEHCDFDNAIFSEAAFFDNATFRGNASFNGADFSGKVRFWGSSFGKGASFDSATFGSDAVFSHATFTGRACFERVNFSGDAQFPGANFSDDASFGSATCAGVASFATARFEGLAFFGFKTWPAKAEHWHRAFFSADFRRSISFEGAGLNALAGFDGIRIAPDASLLLDDLSDAQAKAAFKRELHAALAAGARDARVAPVPSNALARRSRWTRWRVLWRMRRKRNAKWDDIRAAQDNRLKELERGCRALVVEMEKLRDWNRAQLFFRFEIEARRRQNETPLWEKIASGLYDWLGDYGASIARPLAALLLSIPLLAPLYGSFLAWQRPALCTQRLAPACAALDVDPRGTLWPIAWGSLAFSASRALPFGAWEVKAEDPAQNNPARMLMLGEADTWQHVAIRVVATLQSVFALAMAFLSGVAIRRRFQLD